MKIKADSWVVGVKVFADRIWQKVLSGEYQSFGIEGRGVRFPKYDFGEVEIDFILFVPRGTNRKKYFLVMEDRSLKEVILKSILETDEGKVSRVLKEAQLEGEAAEVLEGALQILAKACGLPEPEPEKKDDLLDGGKRPEADLSKALSNEAIAKMDPATQAVVKQLLEENTATKAEAKVARQIAKELKDQQVLKEFVAKAEELHTLPIHSPGLFQTTSFIVREFD